ncbi:hypothetical protein [Fimbriiglobus ruber]|uniref:Uncharacterized protein n=1 Tax=Fimbriiglobus ruber TaxID=1908690 RepID=A0A225CYH9_9BACT|nr:hypothetical protein [Fimbriiglobus ruber]OWK34292.1 hypothetical protein FRUB_10263 [Fimbriiglobus ruber]
MADDQIHALTGSAEKIVSPLATVEWNGETYQMGQPGGAASKRFEDLLIKQEIGAIRGQLAAGFVDQAKYDEKVDQLSRRMMMGEQKPGRPLWVEYRNGKNREAGVILYVLSLFQANHPKMTYEDVVGMAADNPPGLRSAMKAIVPHLFNELGTAIKADPEDIRIAIETAEKNYDEPASE